MTKSKSRRLRAAVTPPSGEGSMARPPAQHWVRWLAPLLVALFTLAAFLPTLQNQLVNWDDDVNFLDNPHYRGLGGRQLRWMWTTFHMGHYLPLTWMTLGLDYLLWGMNPFGYHLTNLLVHAANAVVVYFLVRRLLTLALPSPPARGHALAVSAGFAALLFAVHPLRVESVAWATERRDVLSGLFYLLTLLVYLRACERGDGGRRAYWGSVALFAGALLSKSMAVSLPVVLLILDLYPLRRLGGSVGWWSERARRVYVEKIPFGLLAGAGAALALLAISQIHNMAPLDKLGVPGRLAISAYSLGFYFWKMVVPVTLSPLYELRVLNPWAPPFLLSYAVVLALTALALTLRRRVPGLLAAWLAYVVILLPVLGIFQNGPQIAADRYTYLAGLGWATLAAAALLSCWRTLSESQRGPQMTFPLAGIASCVVVVLGVLTWNQVQVWHDSERLWTQTVTVDPNSPIAHDNLGNELVHQGKLGEAIAHFQDALRLKPDYAHAHNNWGRALAQQSKATEAIEHFQDALRLKPDLAEAHNNWGAVLVRRGQLIETIRPLLQGLHARPEPVKAHEVLDLQVQLTEAIEHFRHALRLKPDLADAHNNWGLALLQQGKPAEAIEHFQQALRVQPDLAEAHANWGLALTQQGKLVEAAEHSRQAMSRKGPTAEERGGGDPTGRP